MKLRLLLESASSLGIEVLFSVQLLEYRKDYFPLVSLTPF